VGDVADRLDQRDNAVWTGSVASMGTGHTGSGQCVVMGTGTAGGGLARLTVNEYHNTYYVRLWWLSTNAASGTETIFSLQNGATVLARLLSTSGVLTFTPGFLVEDGTTIGTDDTWYDIEMAVHLDGTSGEVEVRVNGAAVAGLDLSGIVTNASPGLLPDRVTLTSETTWASVDDLTIKAGFDGFADSDFMARTDGYPKIATLYPNVDGEYDEWTQTGGGTTYLLLDEAQANTSDYVDTSVADEQVSVGLDALPAGAATVHSLKASAYSKGAGTSEKMSHFLRHTDQLDLLHRATPAAMSASWLFRDYPWPTDIRTGADWTVANVNALELGWEYESGSGSAFVSQVAAQVLYSTAASSSGAYTPADIHTRKTHRFVTCWHIQRNDGTSMRFTTADRPLVVDTYTYTPVGGLNASAERREGELRDRNKDFVGIISSTHVTHADLRAGRYRGAVIEEFVVDWRYPFAGKYDFARYWIGNTRWNGHIWEAQVNGLTRWLKPSLGDVYSRTCRHTLGLPKCFVQVDALKYAGVSVESVDGTEPKRVFDATDADIPATLGDDYFSDGRLVFRNGDNYGLETVVKSYTESTRTIELQVPLPFAITTGHYFDVYPGCGRTWTICQDKYDNWINFGGWPWMPGTDKMLQTPS
jgi:uncharacterized phage protein (TIGR02218 family)